jgi:DNA mismatch repair ATPase MutL
VAPAPLPSESAREVVQQRRGQEAGAELLHRRASMSAGAFFDARGIVHLVRTVLAGFTQKTAVECEDEDEGGEIAADDNTGASVVLPDRGYDDARNHFLRRALHSTTHTLSADRGDLAASRCAERSHSPPQHVARAAARSAQYRKTCREDVAACRCVAQFADRRFLLCVRAADTATSGDEPAYLIVADQHGVSERLRLETFPEIGTGAPFLLPYVLPEPGVQVPLTMRADVAKFGKVLSKWHFVLRDGGARLVSVPAVTLEGVTRAPTQDPLTALADCLAEFHATAGAGSPPCVRQLLVERSCRGAVMFGDRLSTDQGTAIMRGAAASAVHFDLCSHGRPTIATLCAVPPQSQNSASWNPYAAFGTD